MKKEKNQLFLLLKKVTKVSVIRKYIAINTSFCLDITSYAQLKNQPHILALSVFPDTKIQRYKNQKS